MITNKETAGLVHNESISLSPTTQVIFVSYLQACDRPLPKLAACNLPVSYSLHANFSIIRLSVLFILESDETQVSLKSISTHGLNANLVNQSEPCQ